MRIGIAQIAPVFLDRAATLERVGHRIDEAAAAGCRLVCFGEALVPGYPIWLDRIDGAARFDDPTQKAIHARYLEQAVAIPEGHLDLVRERAARHGITVVLGTVERALDRGGHSLYCSAVTIGADGRIISVHRKLMPTYEERLAWATGDGAGLVVHRLDEFTLGTLNCWENWMPLARTSLYAAGEDLHVALWPGNRRNTEGITRFIAFEARSYVVSVCGLLREQDLPADLPRREEISEPGETLLDGGSALAGPDGQWVIEPTVEETLLVADLDHTRVREERQNFDVAGHYARPDVLRLTVNRERQSTAEWLE